MFNYQPMIKNFFRFSFRNILKHKGFAFINIFGLAVGLTASLLILLWIQDELSYEKFNTNAENIYRVEEDQFYSGERYHVTVTPHPSGTGLERKDPGNQGADPDKPSSKDFIPAGRKSFLRICSYSCRLRSF